MTLSTRTVRVAIAAGLLLSGGPDARVCAAQPAQVGGGSYVAAVGLAAFDSAWSRIQATYYDSTFRGLDWQSVRAELRPAAAKARSLSELRAVITNMLGRLGESHYSLIPGDVADAVDPARPADGDAYPGDAGLALRLVDGRIRVTRVEPDGPAAAAGVRMGMAVRAIDDYRPDDALARLEALPAGTARRSALTRLLFGVNSRTEGPAGSTLRLDVEDANGQPRTLEVTRRPRPGQPVRFGNLPTFFARLEHERIEDGAGCVGVIRFNVWMVPLVREFDRAIDAVRDCRGIVIDLRGNPGGVAGMVMGVAGHFLDQPRSLGTMRARGSELNFNANPRRVDSNAQAVEPFAGPLAILIDDMSVSTAEIFAGGMQALGRARVFGTVSAGQALPAALVRLPTGDVLMHVVADFTAAGGTRIEGRGVIPDRIVRPTPADLWAGRDVVADSAMAWIRGRPHS